MWPLLRLLLASVKPAVKAAVEVAVEALSRPYQGFYEGAMKASMTALLRLQVRAEKHRVRCTVILETSVAHPPSPNSTATAIHLDTLRASIFFLFGGFRVSIFFLSIFSGFCSSHARASERVARALYYICM